MTPAQRTFYGFLEGQVYGDHALATLQVLAKVPVGIAHLYALSIRLWNQEPPI